MGNKALMPLLLDFQGKIRLKIKLAVSLNNWEKTQWKSQCKVAS